MILSNVSPLFPASILVVLAFASGCAHESQPPRVATTETTSAAMTTRAKDDSVASIQAPAPATTSIAEAGNDRTGLTFAPVVEKLDVPDDAPIEQWSQRYPDASKQLADWMQHYPSTAAKMSTWSAAHPIRMRALVSWASGHKYESLDAFMYGRSGWSDVQAIRHDDPDGTSELLDWIRRSPSAANELVMSPDALVWARDHVKAPKGHLESSPHSAMAPVVPSLQTRDEDEVVSPWTPTMSSLVR